MRIRSLIITFMTNSSVDLYVTDGIQISVNIRPVGKTIKLNVRKSSTVADVKAEIAQKEGILMDDQILMYAGQQLEDNHLLSQCDLRNDQTFHVLVCPNDKLHVFINVRGEKTIGLEAKRWYTVADVKLMIETLEGLPACSQILTRMQSGVCVALADSQMLQDQHVKNNDTLFLQKNVDQHVKNNDTLFLQKNVNIFVKTWEGKTLTMVLKMSDTGKEIMDRLEEKLRIRGSLYYLCHRGRVLSPEDTLQDHEVRSNSTISIHVKMMKTFTLNIKSKLSAMRGLTKANKRCSLMGCT
uniref:Ubiquitin-like domain-containing protein n=1 Tax=Oryza punctata TaxID=4537 RepID=A0A0E0M8Q0_ORYPU